MITIDFETYSEAGYYFDPAFGQFKPLQKGKPGIRGINAAVYAEHPSTRVISLAYEDKLWVPGCHEPADLFWHITQGGLVEAHNAIFEFYIWYYVCHKQMGWPMLWPHKLRCSRSKANAAGFPSALGKLGEVLNVKEAKDKRGTQLIQLLSIPKKPTKKCPGLYRSRKKYPGLYQEMYEYNIQDVAAEKEVSTILPELSSFELKVWQLDQRINMRGMAVDMEGVENCIDIFRQAEAKYTRELQEITNDAVQTVGEITKRSAGDKWLIDRGINVPSLNKEAIEIMLKHRDFTNREDCRRVLEIRQIIGGASIKKLFAIQRMTNTDGRLRELFDYCGARQTGRWAGRGPQPQNLKNSGPGCARCGACGWVRAGEGPLSCGCSAPMEPLKWGDITTRDALKTIATRDLASVEERWGSAVDVVASCLRGLFVAAPGHDLICSDFSAIEAVVLAVLAGEEWRVEVFRTHGKIYEASVANMTGTPLQEILDYKINTGEHHPLRKKGKVRELALGYGGWVTAMKAFGAGEYMADDEIKTDILSWRKESPAIVEFWGGQWRKEPGVWKFKPDLYGLEGAAVSALLYPGQCFSYRGVTYGHDTKDDVLYCLLPSGRKLSYHNPRLTKGRDPRNLDVQQINFMGWNSDSNKGPVGWGRMHTYSGKLAENVTQATARDILAAAMLRLDAAGYPIVMHVHDEIIAEVPENFGSVEEFEQLMTQKEPWFAGWPIKAAGGWRGKRYRK